MLLEPWSTLESACGNTEFLRDFSADGYGRRRLLPHAAVRRHADGAAPARRGPSRRAGARGGLSVPRSARSTCSGTCRLIAFEDRNYGKNATWNRLRGLLFDTHLDLPGHERDSDRDEAARALARASNGVMIDVLEAALDLIEDGDATTATDPELLELARLARREDKFVRRQLREMFVRGRRETLYEALFR